MGRPASENAIVNHFAEDLAARRYAEGRPFFHPLVAERLAGIAAGRLERGLDVGCGTGLSSIALTEMVDSVVGVDSAVAMLVHAERHPRISYAAASAEELPFAAASFQIVSVGSAFHWFKPRAFLAEASRVLGPTGWLAIYNDSFSGRMRDNPGYADWNREQYVQRFPTPARNTSPLSELDFKAQGLTRIAKETFEHDVNFSAETLALYLSTQTNVLSFAGGSQQRTAEALAWLREAVRPFFREGMATFPFMCHLEVYRRL